MNATLDNSAAALLKALHFAAHKHRQQKRKGSERAPYVNHLIAVAELLARMGHVTDPVLLQAAILHDTLEDTATTRAELEREFGPDVAAIVSEVTDDKSLPDSERKQLQVEHAPDLSPAAKQLKIADKISNISELAPGEPPNWTPGRRREYLAWSQQVVAGCRGHNPALEQHYDAVVADRHRVLSQNI